MNIVQMHNMIRTFLDEHRTVRWESDDIDDVLNYAIKEIVNDSLRSDTDPVKSKFESVGKIRNELYPLLKTDHPLPSLYETDGVPVSDFPSDLRQNVRLNARLIKTISPVAPADTVDGRDDTSGVTRIESTGAFADVSAGDIFVCEGSYYYISDKIDDDHIDLECIAHSDVASPSDFTVYSGDQHFIESVDYVTRNEYKSKIKADPFQRPDVTVYPKRVYYYFDDYGIKMALGNTGFNSGVLYIDYIKEPTIVKGGVEYGPETDAGDSLPAVADQDYIAVTECSISGVGIKQPGDEFVLSGGTINWGVVAHDFVNCDLPDSVHEEIVKRATLLIGSIPDKGTLLKIINESLQ